MKEALCGARRLVLKVGAPLLVAPEHGTLRQDWLNSFAQDVARLHQQNQELLLVSSGAVALGRKTLHKLGGSPRLTLPESQAAAALGQVTLAQAWHEALKAQGVKTAQILLTSADTEERPRYLNARSTLSTLLHHKVLPLINENDTIATSDIRYGDNDRLAARVAAMMGCEMLVLFSSVEGLYTADPQEAPEARLIAQVDQMTPEIFAMAGRRMNALSTGGMVTKLEAAQLATRAGCHMIIADGRGPHPLSRLLESGQGTWFKAHQSPGAARKTWIATTLKPSGRIRVDEGAARALHQGKSLLPAGVVDLDGEFERGAAVIVCTPQGKELARGLSAYTAQEIRCIMGYRSDQIAERLGYAGRQEVIHRDDLVVEKES